eukprot:4145365-Pyramimonas_sp.AAC.2
MQCGGPLWRCFMGAPIGMLRTSGSLWWWSPVAETHWGEGGAVFRGPLRWCPMAVPHNDVTSLNGTATW